MKATILWILASGLAVVLRMWPRSSTSSDAQDGLGFPGLVAVSLGIVAAALIAVGLVSGTLPTHLVQISPLVLVLPLLARAPQWGSVVAGAVLSFWLVTMVGIWLFLLGLSRFLSGTFSPIEIALTIVIGIASVAGLAVSTGTGGLSRATRVSAVALAAGIQSVALWLSYQPIIIRR
jgi:hypothetical protein